MREATVGERSDAMRMAPVGLETARLPLGINVQTNATCNLRCRFCQYGQERVPSATLPTELFQKVIGELAEYGYAGTLGLFETNEPLTDPRICSLISHARQRLPAAHLYLFTNGELLTAELCLALLEAGLDRLLVDFYRRAATRILMERGVYPSEALEALLRSHGWADPHAAAAKLVYIERWSFDAWENRGSYANPHLPSTTPMPAGCDRVSEKMFIKPNGNVVACNIDYHEELLLGSVVDQTVLEIWEGEPARALRARIASSRANVGLCSTCTYSGQGGNYHNGIFRPAAHPLR